MNLHSHPHSISARLAFVFILLSLVFQLLSIICGKFAALSIGPFTARNVLTNYWYLGSLACLGLQSICWPLALRRFPLFWAYLFMSGVYVAIPLISRFVFKEAVTPANVLGSLVIMAGIAVLCRGGGPAAGVGQGAAAQAAGQSAKGQAAAEQAAHVATKAGPSAGGQAAEGERATGEREVGRG